MYELPFSLAETLEKYIKLISDYSVFLCILVAMILFGILIWWNRNTKRSMILFIFNFILFVGISFLFRQNELFSYFHTFFQLSFYRNMYFYYWNIFLYLGWITFLFCSKKTTDSKKIFLLIFFILLMTNAIFQLYISDIVGRESLLVLGNTYPMIVVGNLLILTLYLSLLGYKIYEIVKKRKKF